MNPSAGRGTPITSRFVQQSLAEAPKTDKAQRYWEKNYEVIRTVFNEDFEIGENIQKGLNTGANTEFLFGRYEIGLHLGTRAIHDALAGRLKA